MRKFHSNLRTFSLDPVTSSVVAVVERQPSTIDPWHRIVNAFKNMRATAAAARTRISHIPTRTSGHLDRARCVRCPFGNSRFHLPHDREKTNSNPTSGRLKVEILIRPLDTSKLKFGDQNCTSKSTPIRAGPRSRISGFWTGDISIGIFN